MDQAKSSATGKSGGTELVSAHSKDAMPRRRINAQMMQNVLLIWLDNNIDDNNADYSNTITQLQHAVNTVNTFTDADQGVDFLTNIYSEKACMIISGALCQTIVPLIHDVVQLHTIFIFYGHKTKHEEWAQGWSKVKGVFTEISSICEVLKQAVQQCEQNAIPISFLGTSSDISKKNLDQLNPTFMYTQILKEILLTIQFDDGHIKEFTDYCRDVFAENQDRLETVDKLQRKYHDGTPIWWYTCECFLYPMLNRALRLMDMDIIIKMGFFIDDLHRHIGRLHSDQFGDNNSRQTFTVYRGQGMTKTDFDQMTQTKGGLMSFNNFLSTSKDRAVSFAYAESNSNNPDLLGILFIMTIDPSRSTTPFASIIDVSFYDDKEDEVLFSMNTVFRITEIKPIGENHRFFQVELTLTSDNDKDLRVLTDHIRGETFPTEKGWLRLGMLLYKMGQATKARQVFEILLEQTTDEREKGNAYERLGIAKNDQGEYKEALASYEKALKIRQQSLPLNHPHFASCYNNIGNVYSNMGEYPKALPYYEKTLEIKHQSLPPNHPSLASPHNNIGSVYRNMGKYPKALSSYEKALEIQQQSLPPNHPDLGGSYNNIGNLYREMGEYPKALSFFERAVDIGQHSLPSNDPDLQQYRGNLSGAKKICS